jgi:hypothetical protein
VTLRDVLGQRFTPKLVMPGLVPGIHVLLHLSKKDVDGRARRAEATPSLERLCPAMTKNMFWLLLPTTGLD